MKTKILLLHFILLIIAIYDLNGQNNGSTNDINQPDCIQCLTGELFAPVQAIDPETWFNKEWLPGDIYLSNGEIVRNKLIRYNGSLDELFWKEPKSGNTIKLDKEPIVQFHFQNLNGDTTVYFRKIRVKKNVLSDSSNVFGEVIYDKINSLYILHTFNIKGTEIVRTSGTTYEKIIYEKIPVYVFRFTKNKSFVTRSLSRRSLILFVLIRKTELMSF